MSAAKQGVLADEFAGWRYENLSDGGKAAVDAGAETAVGRGGENSSQRPSKLKRVAMSAVDCAVAHWYMVPGLAFQRSRFRLELNSLLGRGRVPGSVRSLILQRSPAPESYLGFHFAARFLSRETLGNYLDVSSPWLFPFTMLTRRRAASATLITNEAARMRSLMSTAKINPAGGLRCEAAEVALADAAYDTITSLCGAGGGLKYEAQSLWRMLKPGGTLLLSVPCIKEVGDGDGAWVYDARKLERDIFDVIGQPKRYAIYGAQTPARGHHDARVGGANQWNGSAAIGRDWRCFPSLQELPGSGVMVMKFSRLEGDPKPDCAGFTPRIR